MKTSAAGTATTWRPLTLLVLSMVSLCVGTSFAKTLFPIAGPAGMTALRIGIAAAILALVQRPWRWRLTQAQAAAVLAYGGVLACMNLSFYAALARLPLGIAIAIEFLGPLGVAIAGSRRAIDLLWVALAGAGVAILVLPSAGHAALDRTGILFALLAALFWALYIIAGKRSSAHLPIARTLGLGLLVASVIAVPAGLAGSGSLLLRPDILLVGVAVALLSSIVPYALELAALRDLPARTFGVVVSLEPAIGALAALAVLGERLVERQWLGMAAVSVASICAVATARRDPPPLPPPA